MVSRFKILNHTAFDPFGLFVDADATELLSQTDTSPGMPVAVQSALSPSTAGVLSRCTRRMEQFRNNSCARKSWFVPQTSGRLRKPSRAATKAPHQPLPPSTAGVLFQRARRKKMQFSNNLFARCSWFVPTTLPRLRKPSRTASMAPHQPPVDQHRQQKISNFSTKFCNFISPAKAICDARLLRGRSYTLTIPIPSPHQSLGSNRNAYDTFPRLFPVTLGSDASTGANAHPQIETIFDPKAVVLRIDVPARSSNSNCRLGATFEQHHAHGEAIPVFLASTLTDENGDAHHKFASDFRFGCVDLSVADMGMFGHGGANSWPTGAHSRTPYGPISSQVHLHAGICASLLFSILTKLLRLQLAQDGAYHEDESSSKVSLR